MHVDQDAVDFMKRFMSFSSDRPDEQDPTTPESPAPAQFIRK
jgi:hypothetical protein